MLSLARAKHLQTAGGGSSSSKSSSSSSRLLDEDMKILAFLHRLNAVHGTTTVPNEDDDNKNNNKDSNKTRGVNNSSSKFNDRNRSSNNHELTSLHNVTTVPIALSRRLLHRQGINYSRNSHVDTVVSIAGEQFLASILQRATICREQRLEGEVILRRERRERRRQRRDRREEKIKVARARRDDWVKRHGVAQDKLKKLENPSTAASGSSVGSRPKKKKKVSLDKDKVDKKSSASSKKNAVKEKDSSSKAEASSPAPAKTLASVSNNKDKNNETEPSPIFTESDWIEWGDGSQLEELSNSDDSDDDSDDDDGNMVIKIQDVVRSARPFGIDMCGKLDVSG